MSIIENLSKEELRILESRLSKEDRILKKRLNGVKNKKVNCFLENKYFQIYNMYQAAFKKNIKNMSEQLLVKLNKNINEALINPFEFERLIRNVILNLLLSIWKK